MQDYTHTQQALAAFLAESGKTQNQVARESGLSTALISQFLGGTYTGSNADAARKIEQYLAMARQRLQKPLELPLVPELYNTQQVLFACLHAHCAGDMALISGAAGAGKTTALSMYQEDNANVILVTANACTKTATEVLRLIAREVLRETPGRKAIIMQRLVDKLNGTNALLIVDEADHLTLEALQAVRSLNDLAGIGIVLAGNDKIYQQMKSPQRGGEFDQIRTRIGVRKKVYNTFSIEEMQALFPGADDICIAFLLKAAELESLRTAKKLYRLAAEFAEEEGQKLKRRHLEETFEDLFGIQLKAPRKLPLKAI